jgi:hypothetical protein
MQTMKRAVIVAAAVLAVLMVAGVAPIVAQQAGNAKAQEPAAAPPVARGELVRVDPIAKMLVIQAQGGQQTFTYTDDTKVSGAGEGVAGLATMAGAQVTIEYTKKGQANIATRIEVQKKG